MEIRKVQISGGSWYIVSLPKKWIKSTRIQKNDPVGLIVQRDGTLLVTPNIKGEKIKREKEFEVSASTDEIYLLRCLISAYIAGYNTIKIRAHGRLPPFVIGLVREFTGNAVGQEVVEETIGSIVIRDLLNPAEMPIQNTLKRMSVIVKGMHEDSIIALKERDNALAEDVIQRDTDVDRLHWLIARQNNLILSDSSLSRRMNVPVEISEHYFLVSRIIERIADHATRIATNVIHLTAIERQQKMIDEIATASELAIDLFQESMDTFHDTDLCRANETIEKLKELEELSRRISSNALDFEAGVAIDIVHIIDSIRRIGEYSSDICESVMNFGIGSEKQTDKRIQA